MNKALPLFFFAFILSSCSKHFVATQYNYEEKRLTDSIAADAQMAAFIKPYRDSLNIEMGRVLCISDTMLTKSSPEGDLGNMMCDLVLKKSKDYSRQAIDFTFLNTGGIRIPNLPKGEITYGKIIELMPFDNLIDVMVVSGYTLDTLFNFMASKGGWPVSGARYKIKGGKAIEVFINGQPLDLNRNYTMAVSDYLANGGDNCKMLTYLPRTILKKNIREAIIDAMMEMNAKGERLKSVLDGRVQKVE
jgi:2',3'-cyclic-nucleotide 2'-phosphodiesterase (5'-nucleotidase family)